jgi:hypothetical protein
MIAKDTCVLSAAGGAAAPPTALNPWLRLIIGIALILFFMFGIGSLAQRIPGARHMAQVIDEHDLRATAIYYTDFDAPAEGSERIRDSLDYTPGERR